MSRQWGELLSKILIIDDDRALRTIIRLTLEEAGYDVVDAKAGREGEKMFGEAPADPVLTDIVMPEQEGVETIMALRRDHPGVKIIEMSGADKASHFLDYAVKLGAQAALTKPFHRETLLDSVQALLRQDLDSWQARRDGL